MNRVADYLPKESVQHWAVGCDKCAYGLCIAPTLTGACALHLERLVQAIEGRIAFCECKAGEQCRVFLLNLRQRLIEESRRDKRWTEYALRASHPEIEWAQAKIAQLVEYMPTIHAA